MQDETQAARPLSWYGIGLSAVLGVSLAVRVIIACRGGQQFWPDEDRYDTAREAAGALLHGEVQSALQTLFAGADHILFKILAVIPALAENLTHAGPWLPALFFASVSVWVIWMTGRVARASGAEDGECLLAVLLTACTTTMFYYARHFFPYDLSLGFFLVALACGLRAPVGFGRSLATGVWASLGFLAYNGYWMLGAAILAIHVLAPSNDLKAALRRTAGALAGLALPVFILLALGRILGFDLYASFTRLAATAKQGDFGIAWRQVGEYFWVSEQWYAALWALAIAGGLLLWVFRRASRSTILWLAIVLALYATMVFLSDVFPIFTFGARHLRIMGPFLCLLTASVMAPLWRRGGVIRTIAGIAIGGVVAQAAINFSTPLRQVFPREFRSLSAAFLHVALARDLGPYQVLNCHFLHNPTWAADALNPGRVVLYRPHPFAFHPYLFESYSELLRTQYLARDLSMRVVRLDAGGPPFAGYPGVIKLTLRLPKNPHGLLPQPLLSTGQNGHGDVLFVRFENMEQLRIGHDHWRYGGALTEPLAIDRDRIHTVVIAMGSLFPPKDDSLFTAHPELLAFKRRLFVQIDDTIVLNNEAAFYPAAADTITIGLNLIGASTAVPDLDAAILSFERLPLESFLPVLQTPSR